MLRLESVDLLVRRYLSIRQASSGSYSPLKGSVLYLSDMSGEQLLWEARRSGCGYRHDLAIPWERRIGGYRVSPAGWLAFSTDLDGDEKWSIYMDRGEVLDLVSGEDGSINNLGEWSPSGRLLSYSSNSRNGVDFDLYVYDALKRSSTMVLRWEGIIIPSKWISEEAFLAVSMRTYQDTDIVLVNIRDGSHKILTPHEGEAINTSPEPFDRGAFAFITNQGEEFSGVAVYDLGRMEWRYLVREPWDVEILRQRKGVLYYTINEDGSSVLKALPLESGRSSEILRIEGTADQLDPFEGGLVISINSPRTGPEIFILEGTGVLERVTYSPKAGIPEELFVAPEKRGFSSFDGLEFRGLYYRPRKPLREPPPAVVYLHGGPESQERVSFNRVQQALLGLGIAVLAPNYRGSSGYGKSFIHLDDVEKRINAVHDVYHAVRQASEKGLIDPGRLCVMGASYGGYLTLMMLATYPDLWRCGVEIVGIVNLVTFIRNTGAWRRRYRIAEYGDPEKHGDVMMKLSPISHLERIRTPLMVIHGARDPRVPVSEAEQLVQAARGKGVEVRYIRLEDEGHGISKVRNRVVVYSEALKFIYSHLSS